MANNNNYLYSPNKNIGTAFVKFSFKFVLTATTSIANIFFQPYILLYL